MACIYSGKGGARMKELHHNIASFRSEYCSCPWLRFPTCFQCCVMRDAVHRNTSSWARFWMVLAALLVPRKAGEGSGLSHPLAVGWGTKPGEPGNRLDWWGRRTAEQSPVVAHGKAGLLLDGKRLGSAFRVTCLGRGHCHQPCSILGTEGQGLLPQPLLRQPPVPGWTRSLRKGCRIIPLENREKVEANLMSNIRCLVQLVLLLMI